MKTKKQINELLKIREREKGAYIRMGLIREIDEIQKEIDTIKWILE